MQNNSLQHIKIDSKDKVSGFYTLLTNGSIICLPDNEYIVPEYVLTELLKKDIKFNVKKTERNKDGTKIKGRILDTSKV